MLFLMDPQKKNPKLLDLMILKAISKHQDSAYLPAWTLKHHTIECSERTVLSCLESVYVGDVSEDTSPIIWQRVMVGQQNHHYLTDDGRSISRNVANINKLVQDKIKLFFQNILQHDPTESTNVHISKLQSGTS